MLKRVLNIIYLEFFFRIYFIWYFSFIWFTGKINFIDLLLICKENNFLNLYLLSSFFFIFIGIFIKLSIAPFHFWTPQIYNGIPYFVLLIILILPKLTLFIFFLKFILLFLIFFNFFIIISFLQLLFYHYF